MVENGPATVTTPKESRAIVPAAGQSSRFGGMKLLEPIGGLPLLQHTLASLIDAGVSQVVVVLAPRVSFSEVAFLSDRRVTTVVNEAPERGMFSSIQTGLAALPSGSGPILVLPADMPFVRATTIGAVAAAAAIPAPRTGDSKARVVVPVHQGRRGHPLALPPALRTSLLGADPSRSLKDALLRLDVSWELLEVDDAGVLRDVDVRGDLDRARGD
jgi:CTP:molybdopterin cytidylyltransferase MocA